MQLDTWAPVRGGSLFGGWCRVEADADSDGFCVIVRARPEAQAELWMSDWHPDFEALHMAMRDYDWQVDWERAQPDDNKPPAR